MAEFVIEERVRTTIEADTAQEALDNWLYGGAVCVREVQLLDRRIEDEEGNVIAGLEAT